MNRGYLNFCHSNLKEEKIHDIKVLYAYHLFATGSYERALEYFLELGIEPLQVIGLYPNLLPRELR